MFADSFLKNPRDQMHSSDSWTRRMALAAIVREPQPSDREIFEDLLHSEDTTTALLAFLGLKKLYPAPVLVKKAWSEIFGESIELLAKRACSGPVQMRIAALKALAFSPDHLNVGLVEKVLRSLDEPVTYESVFSGATPGLPLVQESSGFLLPDGFALLLASLPGGQERVRLLQRELYSSSPARLLPVLLALQIHPVPELTDQILLLIRSPEKSIAKEAIHALLACGGNRVFLMILSLLKETSDNQKKSWLLPLVARTGKEEVWPLITGYLHHENADLRYSALLAVDLFPAPAEDKAKCFKSMLSDKNPQIACFAAGLAWNYGSIKALGQIEEALNSQENKLLRQHAAEALGSINPETSIPILSRKLDQEKSGNVIRQIILSLRKLLSKLRRSIDVTDILLPRFSRLLKSTDPFKRSQTAVLCGILGKPAEPLVLAALEKEHHPHVIASLLASLGKIGTDSLLLFSAFNNHPDPRVRANMINSMITCGGKAVSYFTQGLKDPSPRVRSASARNLFLLGQLDIIPTLNRMLLIPSPVSVLSACHSLGQLLRIQPPVLDTDHPLPLAISRKVRIQRKTEQNISGLLSGLELPDVFKEMAIANGDRKKSLWILEEKSRRFPSSHVVKRMLSAFCTMDGQFDKALSLLEICLSEHPCILADLLDAYRLSLKTGNLEKATDYGNRAKSLYKDLLDGCMALCRSLHGNGADLMLERLHHLTEPSMNLYNAMIQIKVLEGDKETIIDLLSELAIARPNNIFVIRKLMSIIPESYSELAEALQIYSSSFGEY